jgi:glycosyltransferase involved in cell wall biosynthesis
MYEAACKHLHPTYNNGAQYLHKCLDAVLSQSLSNFQVIIVDDQSSDNTWEILNQYATQDNRINLFKNEHNLGLVGNWNRCIELSGGEWIKFVFQDDIIRHDCLELMLKTANVDAPFVLCRRDFFFHPDIDKATKDFYLHDVPQFDQMFPNSELISPIQICNAVLSEPGNFFGEPTSTLIHCSIFERFGLFNPAMVQLCDLEYWIRVGVNIGVKYIPDPLVQFRVHPSSTSSKNKDSQSDRGIPMDRLILLHEFAYNPFYEPLRKFAKQSHQHLNFKTQLAKKAHWQKNIAYSNSTDSSKVIPLINQWRSVVKAYPKLESSIYLIPYKIESWLERHLFWRFNNNA